MKKTPQPLSICDTEGRKFNIEEWQPGDGLTTRVREVRQVVELRGTDRWQEIGKVMKEAVL